MKKFLLGLTALSTFALVANAQQRFVLYEEFTGENCPPCAEYNPGLLALMNSGNNPSKILMIKYMVNIPSGGTLYNQTATITDPRRGYYSVSSAPNGRMDGAITTPTSSSPGHPANMTQAIINTEAAVASPFKMSVTSHYTDDRDSVIATVIVEAVSAYAPVSGDIRLRSALLQTLEFATAPGTNGEKKFENVVRKMYPDLNGTTISGNWAVGDKDTFTIAGPVPSFMDTTQFPYMAVWIQNDHDKKIAQAGVSLPQNDAVASSVTVPSKLTCSSDGSTSVAAKVVISNAGAATLTSATIYYALDNGSYQSIPWTGSLATYEMDTVTLPAISVASAGLHVIYDSVAMPNGVKDQNIVLNSIAGAYFTTVATTPTITLPLNTDFETGTLANGWFNYDANNDGSGWQVVKFTDNTKRLGHNNSVYTAMYTNPYFPAGETDYLVMPASNAKSVNFWVAYAQITSASSDALDVVYSTDCGQNWTSLWSKSGADLATAPALNTEFYPTSAQWAYYNVDVSSAPAGALIAFKATANGGNFLFLDDAHMTPWPASVANVSANANNASMNVYPNPAKENATVNVILDKAGNVTIDVLDAIGRVVTTVANENMGEGTQKFNIATSSLAAGLYHVRVQTDNGTMTQQLSVVK